ncbi:MAG: hypothetical protein ACO1SX_09045 [Actinomycetota bacterium]
MRNLWKSSGPSAACLCMLVVLSLTGCRSAPSTGSKAGEMPPEVRTELEKRMGSVSGPPSSKSLQPATSPIPMTGTPSGR